MKTVFLLFVVAFGAALVNTHAVTLKPVSVANGSTIPAAGNSFLPRISSNGSHVVFISHARNLVTNDDQREWLDVFTRDIGTSNTVMVSVNTNGVGGGNGNSGWASFVPGTNHIVFASDASDLVGGDTNGSADIFLRDLASQQTRLISLDVNGNSPVDPIPTSIIPLSGNPMATLVAILFESRAPNLVSTPVSSNSVNIFARSLFSNVTELVSIDTNGSPFTNFCELASVRSKGDLAVFLARPSPSPLNNSEVYVRMLGPGTTLHASAAVSAYTNAYRCSGAILGGLGDFVAFIAAGLPEGTVLFRFGVESSSTIAVATNVLENSSVQISDNGRFITYTDGTNVFRWDGLANATSLVSANTSGVPSTNGTSINPVATADGGTVLFISNSSDLIPGGSTNRQVYSRDMNSGITRLISVSVAGTPSAGVDFFTTISLPESGTSAVLDTTAADLVLNDTNIASDAFLFPVDGPVARVTLVRIVSGNQLSWIGNPARTYHVEYKGDFSGGNWDLLSATISWNGSTATATDSNAPAGNRFYRVVRQP